MVPAIRCPEPTTLTAPIEAIGIRRISVTTYKKHMDAGRGLRRLRLCITALALFPLLAVNPLRAQACTVSEGSSSQSGWFGGGQQFISPTLRGVYATIDPYNPSPVWTGSSVWVMLAKSTGDGNYAQSGWTHDNGLSYNELEFIEYIRDDGSVGQKYFNQPTNTGGYQVLHTGGNGTAWQFQFTTPDSGSYNSTGSVTWQPDTIQVFNELHNYTYQSGTSNGDHAAGDMNAAVNVNGIRYLDTNFTWQNATLQLQGLGSVIGGGAPSADYQMIFSPSDTSYASNSFAVLDTRCNN